MNYTTSLLTATLISNNIISNNLLYTTTINLNTPLANAVTARDTAISNSIIMSNNYTNTTLNNYSTATLTNAAITTASTTNTTYTNTKIATEVSDRNSAIVNNNNLMLSTVKTYTSTQIFSNIVVLGSFNSISIGNLTNGSSQVELQGLTVKCCTTVLARTTVLAPT